MVRTGNFLLNWTLFRGHVIVFGGYFAPVRKPLGPSSSNQPQVLGAVDGTKTAQDGEQTRIFGQEHTCVVFNTFRTFHVQLHSTSIKLTKQSYTRKSDKLINILCIFHVFLNPCRTYMIHDMSYINTISASLLSICFSPSQKCINNFQEPTMAVISGTWSSISFCNTWRVSSAINSQGMP